MLLRITCTLEVGQVFFKAPLTYWGSECSFWPWDCWSGKKEAGGYSPNICFYITFCNDSCPSTGRWSWWGFWKNDKSILLPLNNLHDKAKKKNLTQKQRSLKVNFQWCWTGMKWRCDFVRFHLLLLNILMNRFHREFRTQSQNQFWQMERSAWHIEEWARNLIARDHHVWTVWPAWAPTPPIAQFAMNRTAPRASKVWNSWTVTIKSANSVWSTCWNVPQTLAMLNASYVARKPLFYNSRPIEKT